jgi:transposase
LTEIPVRDRMPGCLLQLSVQAAILMWKHSSSKAKEYWIAGHVNALKHYGAVPLILVPDNDKSGVTKASYYEPELNRTYQKLAQQYGVDVVPARVRKPKDKSVVEGTVRDFL